MAPPACNYHLFTGCCGANEVEPEKGLRDCHKCGDAGKHHHFCAADPQYEAASAVPNTTATLCALCAGIGRSVSVAKLPPMPVTPSISAHTTIQLAAQPASAIQQPVVTPLFATGTDLFLSSTLDQELTRVIEMNESAPRVRESAPAAAHAAPIAQAGVSTGSAATAGAECSEDAATAAPAQSVHGSDAEDAGLADEATVGVSIDAAQQAASTGATSGGKGSAHVGTEASVADTGVGANELSKEEKVCEQPRLAVGTRVGLVEPLADECSTGIIFLAVGDRVAVTFDDLKWVNFPRDVALKSLRELTAEEDIRKDAVRTVLLAKLAQVIRHARVA